MFRNVAFSKGVDITVAEASGRIAVSVGPDGVGRAL